MRNEKILVGIDPGLTGAIAIVSEDEIIFYEMPVCDQSWSAWKKINKKVVRQKMVDSQKLWLILEKLKKIPHKITIEAVTPLPTYGISSAWKFSGAFYTIITVCNLLGLNLNFITASSWKKKFNFTGMGKDAPRQTALRMYPHLKEALKYKYNQDKADALFIALSKDI